jgi:NAD(P)H-dependent FMN reductase
MSETTLNILAVIGSLHSKSVTRTVVRHAAKQLETDGCFVDTLDFEKEPLALYNPDTATKARLIPPCARAWNGPM